MEITIPAWATWLIGTFGGGFMVWLIFLTKMNYQNKEDIRVGVENDTRIMKELSKLEATLEGTKSDFQVSFKGLDEKFDRIFGEIQFMKGALSAQTNNKPV